MKYLKFFNHQIFCRRKNKVKRFLFFILLILSTIQNLFSNDFFSNLANNFNSEIYATVNVNFQKKIYEENDFSVSTISFIYGIDLNFNFLDLRFYQKTRSIKFCDFDFTNENFTKNFSIPAWSIFFDASKFSIPIQLQLGTLSFYESASKLKTLNIFSKNTNFSSIYICDGIGITTAQKSASEKPFAIALKTKLTRDIFSKTQQSEVSQKLSQSQQMPQHQNLTQTKQPQQKKISQKNSDFKIELQSAYIPKNEFSFSANYSDSFLHFLKLNTLISFFRFDVNSKNSESTKDAYRLPNPEFTSDTKNAFYTESVFSIPLFKTKLSSGILENSFNKIRFFSSAESIFHYGIFSIYGGAYFSDNFFCNYKIPLLTTSSNLSKNIFVAKLNPMVEILLSPNENSNRSNNKNLKIKTGINLNYSDSLLDEFCSGKFYALKNEKISRQNFNLSAQTDFEFLKNKISAIYKIENLFQNNSDKNIEENFNAQKHSAYIKYYFYNSIFSMNIFTKIQFYPFRNFYDSEKNQALGFSFNFKNFPINYFSFYTSFTEKKEKITPTLNATISTKFSIKKVKVTGKIQLKTTLPVE